MYICIGIDTFLKWCTEDRIKTEYSTISNIVTYCPIIYLITKKKKDTLNTGNYSKRSKAIHF